MPDNKYIPDIPSNFNPIKRDGLDGNKYVKDTFRQLSEDGPTKAVCNSIMAEYTAAVKTMNAMVLPIIVAQEKIKGAVQAFDSSWYNPVNQNLNRLGSGVSGYKIPDTIDGNQAQTAKVLSDACPDIEDLIPDSLRVTMTELNLLAKQLGEDALSCAKKLGADVMGALKDKTRGMFDFHLDETMGEFLEAFIEPFRELASLTEASGVKDLMEILKKAERCMMKKGLCDVPKKAFLYPGTNKTNFQYFQEKLSLNANGEFDLKKLITTEKEKVDKLSTIVNKVEIIRNT